MMNGRRAWIGVLLIVAVAGVMYAKNAARQRAAAAPAASMADADQGRRVVDEAAGEATNATAEAVGLPRLVDLGAGTCIPCKLMAPILADLRQTYTQQLEVTFIDVWEKPEAAKPYGINIIPTQIFFDAQGRERFRHEGFYGKEDILAKWKELGVELGR